MKKVLNMEKCQPTNIHHHWRGGEARLPIVVQASPMVQCVSVYQSIRVSGLHDAGPGHHWSPLVNWAQARSCGLVPSYPATATATATIEVGDKRGSGKTHSGHGQSAV